MTENTDFALRNKNVEEWEQAEFWEKDTMQSEPALCKIVLYVDWGDKNVMVETQIDTNTIAGEVYHGLASEFKLPEDTDFKRFAEFYEKNVLPKIKNLGDRYDSDWNGKNWVGGFTTPTDDEEQEVVTEEDIEECLRTKTPTHDMRCYFSLRDMYGESIHSIVDDLNAEGIDLITADLDNDGVMSLAVETVTYGDGSDYKLIDVDVEDELRDIQKELQEEAEEEN